MHARSRMHTIVVSLQLLSETERMFSAAQDTQGNTYTG